MSPHHPTSRPWATRALEDGVRLRICLGLVAAAILLRLWLFHLVDVRDLPGPAGGQMLNLAVEGAFSRSWDAWLLGLYLPIVDGDIGRAARHIGMWSSVAMVLGATLGGWAVAGRRGAAGATAVVATWSLAIFPLLIIGPDPPSAGLSWLGVGLAWAGARLGLKGAPFLAAGCFLVLFAAGVKSGALPAVLLLLATPLLIGPRFWSLLVLLPTQFLVMSRAWELFMPQTSHELVSRDAVSMDTVWLGLSTMEDMPGHGFPGGVFPELLGATLVAGLLPGPRWGRRLILALGAIALFTVVAAVLGERVRPRHLLAASYGIVVMSGIATATASAWLARFGLGIVPFLVVPIAFGLDGWAWLDEHTAERTVYVGAAPTGLPPAPAPWARRYPRDRGFGQRGLTIAGAVTLAEIISDEATVGIAVPRLRDDRFAQFVALATLSGRAGVVLDRGACCGQSSLESCATRLLPALDRAGVTVALPLQTSRLRMVDGRNDEWLAAMVQAAEAGGGFEPRGDWWIVRPAEGEGGPIPCGPLMVEPGERAWPPAVPTLGPVRRGGENSYWSDGRMD